MGKSWGAIENKQVKETANYHMYADGHSYWGLGLVRNAENPLACTQAEHTLSLEEKVKWHGEETERLRILAEEAAKKKKKAF